MSTYMALRWQIAIVGYVLTLAPYNDNCHDHSAILFTAGVVEY
jgi:hypothetical protein